MLQRALKGLAAGAAGTAVLNVITYLDMLVRARPSSSVPAETASRLANQAGIDLAAGEQQGTDSRRTAAGALLGYGAGLGLGVAYGAVEEAARDLGAGTLRTFREVTLPLVWTGLFGSFLFGFTLSWNEYDRTALLLASGQATLPIQIFSMTVGSVIRPDLYALGTATTVVTLLAVGIFLVVAAVVLRRRVRRVVAGREEFGEIATEEPHAPRLGAGARAR